MTNVTPGRMPLVAKGLAPLVLLGVFLTLFIRLGPVGVFKAAFPSQYKSDLPFKYLEILLYT